MSQGLAHSTIVGNLTKDAQSKTYEFTDQDGQRKSETVVKFAVAVNWGSKDDQVDFYDVTIKGKCPAGLLQRLIRGAQVTVVGDQNHTVKDQWQGQGLNCWINITTISRAVRVHAKGIGTSPAQDDAAPPPAGVPMAAPVVDEENPF
jgi:single-stranded DNA-binding protein